MKNIWIFNHYAQCPKFPGGTRHYDFALELIKRGYEVTIFASGFHYTLLKDIVKYNNKGYYIEIVDGIRFVWVKTFAYKINDIKRLVNTVSYYWKRSDGGTFGNASLNIASAGTKTVNTVWPQIIPGPHWMKIYIDNPNHQTFGNATYTLACIP